LLAGCGQNAGTDRIVRIATHANGLAIPVHETFTAIEQTEGFTVSQQGQLRNPLSFSVLLRADTGQIKPARKYLGLVGAHQRLIEAPSSGSGGTSYYLEQWRSIGACWLQLNATAVSETGTPSFRTARSALAQASVADHAQCRATKAAT
jgi:hypothetical protein